jgi:cation diffusion facilitator family transporter
VGFPGRITILPAMTAPAVHAPTIEETAALTRRITRLSVGVSATLTALKAAAWLASGSISMLASLTDSGLDVVASLVTFGAVRYAVVPPDADHRYGHGKAEAFAALLQAGLVFASAALVGREAIDHLLHPEPVGEGLLDIAVLVVSVVLTAGLVKMQTRVLRRTKSVAVTGDRTHYAADLGLNLVALAGIGAAFLFRSSLPDAIGGLLVAIGLLWGATNVFRASAIELMDRELPKDERERIQALAAADPAIRGIHQLRTRASGPYVHIQMHADLDPRLSLAEAHRLLVAAESRVLSAFPAADIIIHPDPLGEAEPHPGAFEESRRAEAANKLKMQ